MKRNRLVIKADYIKEKTSRAREEGSGKRGSQRKFSHNDYGKREKNRFENDKRDHESCLGEIRVALRHSNAIKDFEERNVKDES
jgi:hypothetical protein